MTKENPAQLKKAVEQMHHCTANLARTVPVSESFEGKPVWEGVVHVFEITGHPKASVAYAWSSPVKGSSKRRFFTILGLPPVNSAVDAVRAAIVHEHRMKDA
jgi:hypothetical protein